MSTVLSLLSPRLSCPVSRPVSLARATRLLMPVFYMCPDRWSSMKSAGAPSTDITGLYSALLKAGIVAATGTPVGAGVTITSEDTAAAPSTSSENLSHWSSKNTHCLSQNWVHEGRVDVKGKGRADGPRSTNNKAALAVDAAQRDAELHMQFIVVPPGDEAKPISCPICKETLKTEFLEDDEEWVWKYAVRKDDKVRIGSC